MDLPASSRKLEHEYIALLQQLLLLFQDALLSALQGFTLPFPKFTLKFSAFYQQILSLDSHKLRYPRFSQTLLPLYDLLNKQNSKERREPIKLNNPSKVYCKQYSRLKSQEREQTSKGRSQALSLNKSNKSQNKWRLGEGGAGLKYRIRMLF